MSGRRERTFAFRLTAEGFAQFARELEATGEAGARAVSRLAQASPQLASSIVAAAETIERKAQQTASAGKVIETTAREVTSSAQRLATSGGGFSAIGAGASQLDTRFKALGRTMNDTASAFSFVGLAGGAVATQLEPARRAVLGLADVAGAASAALGAAGSRGLFGALTRFVPALGLAVAGYQLFSSLLGSSSSESERAAEGTDKHSQAMRRLIEATETAEERIRRLNDEKRKGLELDIAGERSADAGKLARLQAAELAAARRVGQEGAALNEIEGQAGLVTGAGGSLSAGAQRRIATRRAAFEVARNSLLETQREIRELEAKMIDVEVRAGKVADAVGRTEPAARGGARAAGDFATTMARLSDEADRAARTVVDRLLRSSESDWDRYERDVAEAQAAMQRLAEKGELTANEMERINRSLEAASPAAAEARRAAEQARREQEREAQEFATVWRPAVDFPTQDDPAAVASLEEALR